MDIDDPVLEELKRLQRREGKSMGRLVSDLLVVALARSRGPEDAPATFEWISRDMGARVDIADPDALHGAMHDGAA